MKGPASGEMSDVTNTKLEQKADFEQLNGWIAQLPGASLEATYTLDAGGAIKPTVTPFVVDTFGAAAADDLSNITVEDGATTAGYPDGSLILFRSLIASRVVTVKHLAGGSGQIDLVGAADFVLNSPKKWLVCQRRGTTWFEVFRSYGGDTAAERAFLGLTKSAIVPNPANPGDDGKAIVAQGGNWTIAVPTVAIGPAQRLLVSRTTSDQTVGLANGTAWSQVQPNAISVETSGGNLWDAGTFEIKIPAGVTYIRVATTLAIGFSSAPTAEWWVEAFLFRKPNGGAYPATPDTHTTPGLLSTSFQAHATALTAAEINGQSGEIGVATGDRFKLMLRAFAQGGGNNVKVLGASLPAYCWIGVEMFA